MGPSRLRGHWLSLLATFAHVLVEGRPDTAVQVDASGHVSADGASVRSRQPARSDFSSPDVLTITTQNFNETVVRNKRGMIIAFYDQNSMSFKELKAELETTASELARLEESGDPLGRLGACDVTIHSFLGVRFAPEMEDTWQAKRRDKKASGTFEFGQPRYFAMILVYFRDGERVREYTGVVGPKSIIAFLRKSRAPREGYSLATTTELHQFLQRPGPLVVGCGLEDGSEDERRAYNASAHDLHGTLVFGQASGRLCADTLASVPPPWPRVVWARGNGAVLASVQRSETPQNVKVASPEVAANSSKLTRWLGIHRAEVLEQMSADNSHTYLTQEARPLVVLLVDATDKAAFAEGERMFEEIEQEPGMELFNFVWADCRVFGNEFGVQGLCPVLLLVNAETMEWRKLRIADLTAADGSEDRQGVRRRLVAWLWEQAALEGYPGSAKEAEERLGPLMAELRGELLEMPPSQTENGSSSEDGKENSSEDGEEKEDEDGYFSHGREEDFARMPRAWGKRIRPENVTDVPSLLLEYHQFLQHMVSLRESYLSRFDHLAFDFEDISKAQQLHRHLRLIVQNESMVKKIAKSRKGVKKLWAKIEDRLRLETEFRSKQDYSKDDQELWEMLRKAHNTLVVLHRRLYKFLHSLARTGKLGAPKLKPIQVERRDASELSIREFLDAYAIPGEPVVITGLKLDEEEPWTLQYFRKYCNVTAEFRQKNSSLRTWAKLQDAGELPLAEFIDTFASNLTRRSWYLHDWTLPRHCPGAFGPPPFRHFTVPKYFAGDYFQRAPFAGRQHSWPSLFIGSSDTESRMHIDSGATNFWLYLLSGQKKWRFYHRRDLVNLYLDPKSPNFFFDPFEPNIEKFPLSEYAQLYEGVQEPGELIFIPAGNPHAVRNLLDHHALSMNYVDASNVWMYLWDALQNDEWNVIEAFTDKKSMIHGLRSDQQNVRFGDWKSTNWNELEYDIEV